MFLTPSFCCIPTNYTLPKVHKDAVNPPARPIVNIIGSVTARLGQYLDKFLQTSVVNTRAYLKDTRSFLELISEVNLAGKPEVYLVTADVSSLYTIIPHDDALLSLNWALSQQEYIPHEQKVFLGQGLDFCLSHNYFWYSQGFYSQKRGVAMGAKFAPSIAKLFMAEWEDKSIFANRNEHLLFYRRYIDDLFFIWEGDERSLHNFLRILNLNKNNIKLEYEFSREHNSLSGC